MEIGQQTNLQFINVGFPTVQFYSKRPLETADASSYPINANIDANVYFPPEDKQLFSIVMNIRISSTNIFDLTLVAVGAFRHEDGIAEELKKSFINVNAPAIVFPYVRSFVSLLTSNLGFILPHVLLPTQFFKGELTEIKVLGQSNNPQ